MVSTSSDWANTFRPAQEKPFAYTRYTRSQPEGIYLVENGYPGYFTVLSFELYPIVTR
ncbi:hypothetical protein [Geitlerinema sp. PCC 9228]|jgi:hypothetical protein|uniref:hypothetical protein n=1 Tax=Geitlerinema sp. PCC 9228 TaxID=111611 RepID=UPI001B8D0D2C|nr:hypothetical protein [Geitlerinema sp. PCC 9228]